MLKRHSYIIYTKWFRVYYRGEYAWFELDFGRAGYEELAVFLFNTDCLFKCRVFKEKRC